MVINLEDYSVPYVTSQGADFQSQKKSIMGEISKRLIISRVETFPQTFTLLDILAEPEQEEQMLPLTSNISWVNSSLLRNGGFQSCRISVDSD